MVYCSDLVECEIGEIKPPKKEGEAQSGSNNLMISHPQKKIRSGHVGDGEKNWIYVLRKNWKE